MRCYWFRIGAGAVAIFFVGMMIIGFTRRGVDQVKELASSIDDVSIPTDFVPFSIGGDRFGWLEKVGIERGPTGELSSLRLIARIDDPAAQSGLADCRIGLGDLTDLDHLDGFSCVSEADSASGRFVPFGAIRLEPAGESRTLYAPSAMIQEVRAAVQPKVESVPSDARLHLRANEAGAHLDIQGDGEGLFYLRADSSGARIVIRDDSGRVVLNLKADSTGAAMDLTPSPLSMDGEGDH